MLDSLRRDLRFVLRQLRNTPGFTVTAILVLALGMCASLAIFAFVDAALIKPLPYREPGRLLGVSETTSVFPRSNLSYPDYLDWKKRNTVFSSLDVYQANGFTLTTAAGGEPVRAVRVSDGFFHIWGSLRSWAAISMRVKIWYPPQGLASSAIPPGSSATAESAKCWAKR